MRAYRNYRYGDIFDLKIEIAKETENCVISRFVLQPLVENSIIHGFDDMEGGGEVTVRSFFEGSNLCLEVLDNGCGMDADTLAALNGDAAVTENPSKTGRVGIATFGNA
jgi:two-component system sensor histidine kinase YesM